MESAVIYACKCKSNGKLYIGSTKNLANRIYRHKNEARKQATDAPNGYIGKKSFYEDINIFGWDNFQWYVIEQEVPLDKRFEREDYWIEKYQTTNPMKGYNKINAQRSMRLPDDLIFGLP